MILEIYKQKIFNYINEYLNTTDNDKIKYYEQKIKNLIHDIFCIKRGTFDLYECPYSVLNENKMCCTKPLNFDYSINCHSCIIDLFERLERFENK